MTEAEWLAADNPDAMLRFLRGSGRANDRKLRLFACACVRRVWPLLPQGLPHEVVQISEEYADGKASSRDLGRVRKPGSSPFLHPSNSVSLSLAPLLRPDFPPQAASEIAEAVTRFVGWECRGGRPVEYVIRPEAVQAERQAQAALLHDIFGPLPFRPVPVAAAWVAWNNGTVRPLAEAIYAERAFERMGVLADALEESGCDDAEILAHCREQASVHAPGCWLLDLLLKKE